jgi:hypothetical protein
MTIEQFAAQYRVRVVHDKCGDLIVSGKCGRVGDGYNGDVLGVYVNGKNPRKWSSLRRKLVSVGMRVKQSGDVDGVLLFDPTDQVQARLALKVAGIFSKRKAPVPSPAQLAARVAFADRQRKLLEVL